MNHVAIIFEILAAAMFNNTIHNFQATAAMFNNTYTHATLKDRAHQATAAMFMQQHNFKGANQAITSEIVQWALYSSSV